MLTIGNAVTDGVTSISFMFAVNTFTLAGIAGVSVSGCGTTTFTTGVAASATATAKLTLPAATATLDAYEQCTVSVATGVTASSVTQAAGLTTRAAAVTLAGLTDINAGAITSSTQVVDPAVTHSSLVIARPETVAASSKWWHRHLH